MNQTINVHRGASNNRAYRLGLIGYPLTHSLSPQIHNAALKSLGLAGEYRLHSIPLIPEGQTQLIDLLSQIRKGSLHGLNVTIPHKQNIIPLLDDLTPTAEGIGAVNTIYKEGEMLIGDNTDAAGFWMDVQRLAGSSEPIAQSSSHSALVLGAGGSARAVAYALLSNGYSIIIAARRIDQARLICNQYSEFSKQIGVADLYSDQLTTTNCSLIINTTPIGMHPHIDASPLPEGVALPDHASVYDLVYNPHETLLVRQAQAAGLNGMTGLGMLVEQAALSFERWTGLEAPRQEMMKAALSNL